jgi:hypothetical protein
MFAYIFIYIYIYAYVYIYIYIHIYIYLYVGGIWGLISAGLLASKGGYEDTYADAYDIGTSGHRSTHCMGVFYGGSGAQLTANCLFILTVLSWTVCSMIFCIGFLKILFPKAFKEEVVAEDHILTNIEILLQNKTNFCKGMYLLFFVFCFVLIYCSFNSYLHETSI